MTEREIKLKLSEKLDTLAKEIHRGKKIEIDTSNVGLKILSVEKKVVK